MTASRPSSANPAAKQAGSAQRDGSVERAKKPKGKIKTDGKTPGKTAAANRNNDLSDWAEQIYTAPKGRAAPDALDAKVTVSTRLRKPRVHLTAPTTVPHMDLERYMGRWYEIARLPYFTQRRCIGQVHADYHLGDDGLVHILNQCAYAGNGIGEARGIARVVDPGANTKLEISFRTLYGVHVLWDDYWVIGLGADYEYALVGQPSRRRGWVLAREPKPSEQAILGWLQEFEAKGYPAQAFERTLQTGV